MELHIQEEDKASVISQFNMWRALMKVEMHRNRQTHKVSHNIVPLRLLEASRKYLGFLAENVSLRGAKYFL